MGPLHEAHHTEHPSNFQGQYEQRNVDPDLRRKIRDGSKRAAREIIMRLRKGGFILKHEKTRDWDDVIPFDQLIDIISCAVESECAE